MNREHLIESLKLHEGFRAQPYKDTVGVLTIGYGRNLEKGITQAEAEFLLEGDINTAIADAMSLVPSFNLLSPVRQEVMVEMAFNLGKARLGGFKKMLAAVEAGDWLAAGREGMDSLWAKQVRNRAVILMNALVRDKF